MDEHPPESREPDHVIWTEIERIAFLSSVVAILAFTGLYFLVQTYMQKESPWYDFLLGVITNIIPIFLVFLFSYVFLRRIQAIRSQQNSEQFISKISRQVNADLRHELQEIESRLRKDIDATLDTTRVGSPRETVATATNRIRVLFIGSSPSSFAPVDLTGEVRRIKDALRKSELGSRFEFISEIGVRKSDLQVFLGEVKPNIVHISAPGDSRGGVILENDSPTGTGEVISARELSNIISVFRSTVKLVVLNFDDQDGIAEWLSRDIDYVVSADAIHEKDALEFSSSFYQALGNNLVLEEALKLANVCALKPGKSDQVELYHLYNLRGSDPKFRFYSSDEVGK